MPVTIKKVGIFYHPKVEATRTRAGALQELLEAKGVRVWLESAWETESARDRLDGTDLILTVGGDGTILRAAQVAVPAQIPLTGINLGKLGFLTELGSEEAERQLPRLLAGEGWTEERSVLEITAGPAQGTGTLYAINDAVMARGGIARLIYVSVAVNGEALTTYRTDGVIIATATGSTGYSLAAGGPILYPESPDFLLVPVAPHLSPPYAVVLPATAEVRLDISAVHEATLSVDGHINLPLASGDAVVVKTSLRKARFRRLQPKTYFYGSLERRLKGKI